LLDRSSREWRVNSPGMTTREWNSPNVYVHAEKLVQISLVSIYKDYLGNKHGSNFVKVINETLRLGNIARFTMRKAATDVEYKGMI